MDKKELLKTTATEVVAKFKVRKKYPCNNMVDGKSAFPYPIALAATFNENLVLNVGEAYAREVLAEGVDASHDACITFNAEMGNSAYSFGEGEVNLHLTAAFSKGLEKGGAVAFPSVNYGSKAAEALIKSNASHGIMLGVGEAKPADIARFRGLIYGKSTLPVVSDGSEAYTAEEISAMRLAKMDIPSAGVYTAETLALIDTDKVESFAKRISGVVGERHSEICPKGMCTEASHKLIKDVAAEGVVMLKDECLPFDGGLESVAVIGKSAGSFDPFGADALTENCLQAIAKVFGKKLRVNYLPLDLESGVSDSDAKRAEVYAAASDAVFIFFDAGAYGENLSYIRKDLKNLTERLSTVKSTVAVVFGAPTDVSPFENSNALLLGWYAGGCAARHIVNVICGSLPFGKLPYKIIKSVDTAGNKGFYPLGYGLCYTNAVLYGRRYETGVEVYLRNRSLSCLKETVQIYKKVGEELELVAFKKVRVDALDRRIVHIPISASNLKCKLFLSGNGGDHTLTDIREI